MTLMIVIAGIATVILVGSALVAIDVLIAGKKIEDRRDKDEP